MIHDVTKLQEFAKKLHSDIKDFDLLSKALTHRSYLGDYPSAESNERLEFLGDSVVGIVIADYLFNTFPDRREGELAKAKAVAVSEPILAEAALSLGVDEVILMSVGEDGGGGRKRPSILSDAFEALVAVVYLDCGLEAARAMILSALSPVLDDIERGHYIRDFKTALQELTQGSLKKAPFYAVTSEEGADHDKTFTVEVRVDDVVFGTGLGKNKKQAEQAAAKSAIKKVQEMLDSDEHNKTG